MPGESGVTVVTMLVYFFILHARLRAHPAPGIRRTLCFQTARKWQDSRMRGEIVQACPRRTTQPVDARQQSKAAFEWRPQLECRPRHVSSTCSQYARLVRLNGGMKPYALEDILPVRYYDWIAHFAAERRTNLRPSISPAAASSLTRNSTLAFRALPRICATG